MSAIILESSLVHYEALGRGKPLLFLHGWLGSWRYWVPTMVDMSSSYRAYALDFWGFGDSDKVQTRYTVEGYVAQIAQFMDQMAIGRVPLIGHGLGGVVAMLFTTQFPDRVEQLTLISTPLENSQVGRALSSYTGGDNPAARILGRRLNTYQEVALEAPKTDGEAVIHSVRSALSQDMLGQLEATDLPVILVYGQDDPIVTPPDEDVIEDLDYNVNAFILQEVQHYPMLEQTNKFNRLLRDFLMHKDNWDEIQLKDEWRRRMR